jgi:hypothetical protein
MNNNNDTKLPPGRVVAVSIDEIVLKVTGWSILLVVVPLVLYGLVHGFGSIFAGLNWLTVLGLIIFFTLWHEGFHAIGWKYWGELRWQDLKFGVMWYALTPYCHAKAPMEASAYRFGAILPGIMTGLLPYLLALVVGNNTMALVGAVMISGAVGDLYVLWLMRDIAPDARVLDHPSLAGCIVIDEGTRL